MFLLQVFSALIKIVVFVTAFTFMLFILFCCFFWKNGNTKHPRKNIVLFSF